MYKCKPAKNMENFMLLARLSADFAQLGAGFAWLVATRPACSQFCGACSQFQPEPWKGLKIPNGL